MPADRIPALVQWTFKNAYVVVNGVDQNVYFYRLTRRAEQPIPERFAQALKRKNVALVTWVAGEVVKWPAAKAEPVLKAALAAQSGTGAEAIKKALEGLR